MDLNLATFIFLFLRLAPFILITFFTLSSVFNNDLRGLIYIFGVLLSIFTNYLVGNNKSLGDFIGNVGIEEEDKSAICDFAVFGTDKASIIPIGETIISFTFFYLFTTLTLKDQKHINDTIDFSSMPNVPSLGECFVTPWQMLSLDFLKFIPMMFYSTPNTSENLPTIIFFTVLILFDVFWNTNLFRSLKELMYVDTKYCYTLKQSGFAYLIGLIIGVIWANIIYSSKTPELQYFPEYKNNEMCKKASPTKYKCTVYKNGEMVKNLS